MRGLIGSRRVPSFRDSGNANISQVYTSTASAMPMAKTYCPFVMTRDGRCSTSSVCLAPVVGAAAEPGRPWTCCTCERASRDSS
eukprot:501982-Prymnesium_polylepis.1